MTRNNLADHLAWLLHNTSLSKPTTPVFPSNSDPSSFEEPQSQPRGSLNRPHTRTNSFADSDLEFKPHDAAPENANGLSTAGNALEDITEATLGDWNMGRLTSTSKSKKPSLFSKLDQLPTPAPTTERKPLTRVGETTVPSSKWIDAHGLVLFSADLCRCPKLPPEETE